MKKFRLAICKGPDCKGNGSDAIYRHAASSIERLGLGARCELYRGGCYGLCRHGPNAVLREDTGAPKDPFSREDFELTGKPGETYYWRLTNERIDRVLQEHVAKGEVAGDLVGDPDAP